MFPRKYNNKKTIHPRYQHQPNSNNRHTQNKNTQNKDTHTQYSENQQIESQQTDVYHTELLNCLYFLLRNLYFPGWNTDEICSKKLIGMMAEYTSSELEPLVVHYHQFFYTLEYSIKLLLQDESYPNRRLHFDCKRLSERLAIIHEKDQDFYPHTFMAFQLYHSMIEVYPNLSQEIIEKCVGMLMDVHPIIGLFQLYTNQTYLQKEIIHALETLYDHLSNGETIIEPITLEQVETALLALRDIY